MNTQYTGTCMTSKRQKILNATLQLAVDTGIDAISTLNIAKTAGVAKATLFHHFPTKSELIDAVYKSIKSDFDFFSAPEDLSFEQQFFHMWRSSLDWALENPQKITFLNAYYTATSVPSFRRREAKNESTIALRKMITQAQKNQEIATENAEMLIEFIYALFMSTALLLHSNDKVNTEQYISDSLSIVRRTINI